MVEVNRVSPISNIWGIATKVLFIIKPNSIAAEILTTLNEATLKLVEKKGIEDIHHFLRVISFLKITYENMAFAEKMLYRRQNEISDKWYQEIFYINSILKKLGIDKKISENLLDVIEEVKADGEVFNASRYWMDWLKTPNKYEYLEM